MATADEIGCSFESEDYRICYHTTFTEHSKNGVSWSTPKIAITITEVKNYTVHKALLDANKHLRNLNLRIMPSLTNEHNHGTVNTIFQNNIIKHVISILLSVYQNEKQKNIALTFDNVIQNFTISAKNAKLPEPQNTCKPQSKGLFSRLSCTKEADIVEPLNSISSLLVEFNTKLSSQLVSTNYTHIENYTAIQAHNYVIMFLVDAISKPHDGGTKGHLTTRQPSRTIRTVKTASQGHNPPLSNISRLTMQGNNASNFNSVIGSTHTLYPSLKLKGVSTSNASHIKNKGLSSIIESNMELLHEQFEYLNMEEVDIISSLLEAYVERLQSLQSVKTFFEKQVQFEQTVHELKSNPSNVNKKNVKLVSVAELLLEDLNPLNSDIENASNRYIEIYVDVFEYLFGKRTNYQKGGNSSNTLLNDLIKDVYDLDIKVIKYDQVITYKSYLLIQAFAGDSPYATVNGGGWFPDLTKVTENVKNAVIRIHERFASYTPQQKINALQSLTISLVEYLLEKMFKKLRIPEYFAQTSIVTEPSEFIANIVRYMSDNTSPTAVVKTKIQIYKNNKNDPSKVVKYYKSLLDILLGIGSLAQMLFSSIQNNGKVDLSILVEKQDDISSKLESMCDGLRQIRQELNESTNKSVKERIAEFFDDWNPTLFVATEYTTNRRFLTLQEEINKTVFAIQVWEGRKNIGEEQLASKKINELEGRLNNLISDPLITTELNGMSSTEKIDEVIKLSSVYFETILEVIKYNLHNLVPSNEYIENLTKAEQDILNTVKQNETFKTVNSTFQGWSEDMVSKVSLPAPVTLIFSALSPVLLGFKSVFVSVTMAIGQYAFLIMVVNLVIVAIHYLIRSIIFFWKRHAQDKRFDIDKFINEIKYGNTSTDIKTQNGGKQRRQIRYYGGTGNLGYNISLPSIIGTSVGTVKARNKPNNSNVSPAETLKVIAKNIKDEIVNYNNVTKKEYKLTNQDMTKLYFATERLAESSVTDLDVIYNSVVNVYVSNAVDGSQNVEVVGSKRYLNSLSQPPIKPLGKLEPLLNLSEIKNETKQPFLPPIPIKRGLTPLTNPPRTGGTAVSKTRKSTKQVKEFLNSKNKKDLITYARGKGISIKSQDKKDEVIQAILKYNKKRSNASK